MLAFGRLIAAVLFWPHAMYSPLSDLAAHDYASAWQLQQDIPCAVTSSSSRHQSPNPSFLVEPVEIVFVGAKSVLLQLSRSGHTQNIHE